MKTKHDVAEVTESDREWFAQQIEALPTELPSQHKSLTDMSHAEIIAMLMTGTDCPRARAFLADLYETYEPHEVPEILATLARAAEALRDKPVDFDCMDLSWRELMTQTGVKVPADFEVPGVTDRIRGALDMPLSDLEKHIGPHEFRLHLRKYGEQLDRENAET